MISKVWDLNSISCQTKLWNQFFAESLTLIKLNRLTITQRIKLIKTYYKNGVSATATYRALRRDYGLNCPTTLAIRNIVKKFEETGLVTNIERPVHYRFARSADCCKWKCCPSYECVDTSSFSWIRTVLRHIMAYFVFRSTPTSI